VGAELEKKFGEETTASLSYSWEHNDSNDADDRYDVSVVSLGLSRTF
jgi:hypothetical protein